MHLSENRALAWGVLAVCALGSVVGLGGMGLARERAGVEKLFYSGANAEAVARESMDAYLDRAAECASLMASELELRLGAESATAQKMHAQLERFGDEHSIAERYAAYTELQRLSDEAYNAVYASALTDGERRDFKNAYDDFWGCDKYVRIDPYRAAAAAFNDRLDGFPAGAVAKLMGVEEIESFGG